MKKFIFLIPIFFTLLSCDKEEQGAIKIEDGLYNGTFQRELVWSESEKANITLTFSSNEWVGTSDFTKYPALCHGTYSIIGDSIIFNNGCAWTAEFDWSLILSGKYAISKNGDKIEFTRDYRNASNDTYIDRYILTKQN